MQVHRWNGRPISMPGWYTGIPIDAYHGPNMCDGPAVSSSDLRTCWRLSPKHAHLHWAENPQREPKAPTRAMTLGAAAHWLLLGEDNFKLRYVATPETYRDKKTAIEKPWHNGADFCKRWNAQQAAAGRVPVTVPELRAIVELSRSLALEPLVDAGLLRGHIECSGFAKDQETGLWMKIRPDVVPPTGTDFVDIKTCSEITTPALQSSIRSFGYHQQGALIWTVSEALETPFTSFVLMFVETAPPWCARAVPIEVDDLARGRMMNKAMLRHFATCIINDHWPGPGEGELRALPLATAERERIDQRLQFEGVLSDGQV